MTVEAIRIYSFAFLIMGFNIYASALFTALNNGPVSAFVSFIRTVVFQVLFVLVLPVLFGLRGVWFSIVTAEFLAMLVSLFLVLRYRNRYGYL